MFSKFRISWSILLLAVVAALVIAAGCVSVRFGKSDDGTAPTPEAGASAGSEGLPPEFDILAEVWAHLQEGHLRGRELDPELLSQGAARGIIEALDDPHAAYLTPEQQEQESQDLRGEFEGIGAHVGMRDGRITIIAPIADTPADKAGLKPGDILTSINGESAEGLSIMEAVGRIRGPKGEAVELGVFRPSRGEPLTVTIVRDVILVDSVSLRMLVGRIAHLRITSFTDSTNQEAVEAIETLHRLGASGIILDLRNNPGGLLRTVVDVTSQFVDEGIALYEVDGQGKRNDWPLKKGGLARDIPMVVLVNEYSASGSEVLAGAIRDNDRAPIIGVVTFGKGSVNTLRRLSDGSGIFFTIAHWHTPSGTLIEGDGLEPDIVVEQTEDSDDDLQLDRAIEELEILVQAVE